MLRFSKEKMLKRLIKEGKCFEATHPEIMSIMTMLDGCVVEKNRFKALVYDEEEYVCYTSSGACYPVNIDDCIEVSL